MWAGSTKVYKSRWIDRTLDEICKAHPCSTDELEVFARLLKSLGVSLIEIHAGFHRRLEKIPADWFVFRIETMEDLNACIEKQIKYCVLKMGKLPDKELMVRLHRNNVKITLEVAADRVKQVDMLVAMLDRKMWRYIHTIRLTGLREYEHKSWAESLEKIRQQCVELDLCPSNSLHMAGAIAVEGLLQGVQTVTGSFSGFGQHRSYAPLEEVMTSMAVLGSTFKVYNLAVLPELCKKFCEITGKTMLENKPVIGSAIFTYESGIHAHGIERDPITYEPFAPELVGQKRQMKIGKHSGRKSVEKKLSEMGINSNKQNLEALLEMIRSKSILLKRDLLDEEIVSLLEA